MLVIVGKGIGVVILIQKPDQSGKIVTMVLLPEDGLYRQACPETKRFLESMGRALLARRSVKHVRSAR